MKARLIRSLAAASLTAGLVLVVVVPRVGAISTDIDDSITPANITVTASTPSSGAGEFTATGVINGLPITVKCKGSTFTGKTPAHGRSVTIAPPTFTGCTDSAGGSDVVATNSTHGNWTATGIDAANDEAGEIPGDKLKLTVPKAGATFTSSILSSCTVIVAPTASASVTSQYDDVSKATLHNGNLPVGNNRGCATGPTSTLNATYTLSPGIHDVS